MIWNTPRRFSVKIKTNDIIQNTEGRWSGKWIDSFTHFSIDSRNIKSGSFFITLKGKHVDSHDFISGAVDRGAKGIAIQRECKNIPRDIFTYRVNSTKNFLISIGELARKKIQGEIIGITGSAGKTTTKEMINLILRDKFSIVSTRGNANTELSIPLFLLNETVGSEDLLIAEMGVQKKEDMNTLIKILKPDIALLLNIGNSHLEFLKDKKGVAKEKFKLVKFVKEKNGKIILNGDDPLIRKLSKNEGVNALYFGTNRNEDVRGSVIKSTERAMSVKFSYKGKFHNEEFPFSGMHFLYDILASVSLGLTLEIPINESLSSLKNFSPVKGRGKIISLPGKVTIIDETYNSNPTSLVASLTRVKNHKGPLIVIAGDMLELGKKAKLLHRKAGANIAKVKPELLISIGKYAKEILSGAKSNDIKNGVAFTNREEAKEFIRELKICKNSVIFIKGSRGVKMEEIIEIIKERFEK